MDRSGMLRRLADERFDLLVIGGGITGCGVAHEAARRGLRVALVERRDFAWGTSSRSTKLIHGGLRYLREFHFRLVRESVRERQRLIRLAPHLARPMAFLLPVYRGDPDPLWAVRIGLWLYDRYARDPGAPRHRMLRPQEVLSAEPLLEPGGLLGGALYMDALTDDARLTVTVARAAARAGAAVVNHAAVTGFLRDARGRVCGAQVVDRLAPGTRLHVRARTVLNASGPWADLVRRLDDPAAAPVLRLSKGIHLAFLRSRLPLRQAVTMRGPDGRIMFAVPRGAFTYAGTTETAYAGDPEAPAVEPADAAYVLAACRRNFPGLDLGPDDVVAAWAGVRALVDPGSARDLGSISREFRLFSSPSGLVTVAGGKLTGYRAMAAAIVDALFPETRGAALADEPLPGGEEVPSEAALAAAARRTGLDPQVVRELADRYGGEFGRVLDHAEPADAACPPRLARLRVETRYAVREEMACTLGDVLWRRTSEALWSEDNARGVAADVAGLMAELLGWAPARREEELAAFRAEVDAMHAWKAGSAAAATSLRPRPR